MAMKSKKPKRSKKPAYSLSLKIGDKVFESTGSTPSEALGNLPKPDKIMAKGTMTVMEGDKKKVLLL